MRLRPVRKLKLAKDLIINKSLKSVYESSWLHGVKIYILDFERI